MNIVLATDHRGFQHKEFIKKHKTLAAISIEWLDVGAFSTERSDYPEFAIRACSLIKQKKAEHAILLCASGVGMAIVANRYQGIYAALAWNEEIAKLSAQEDKSNVLALPADYITQEQAIAMVGIWLSSKFLGGRYQQRIDQIDALGGL